MNKSKRSTGQVVSLLCSGLAAALTGCTTYVTHTPPRTVYASPPPAASPVVVTAVAAPVVVVQSETDFYGPLSPYGSWIVIGSYGRCWRPTRVDPGWRPYCNGHWQRTDAGWYWASDEPWAWATYHYGRWDWSVEFGWLWVPHTQWAPAWVSWRQGAGYVGWAPLPASARIGASGIVEVHESAFAPRAFVFVSEQRLLEPVRPATVIVNNTTVINQTVNITKIQVVNQTVINEGPRPEIIERKSGRKIQAVPVHELRRQEETAVVTRQRNIPTAVAKKAEPAVRTEAAPVNAVPTRALPQVEKPAETTHEPPPSTIRNEVRGADQAESAPKLVRPGVVIPARKEGSLETKGEKARSDVRTVPAGISRSTRFVAKSYRRRVRSSPAARVLPSGDRAK